MQAVQFTSFQTFLDKPFDIILDRKVILKVDVRRLGLDANTLGFLALVAGPRYKPSSHCLKMVTTRYHTVIENKRHLLEQLQALVRESSALSKEFSDKWKDGR